MKTYYERDYLSYQSEMPYVGARQQAKRPRISHRMYCVSKRTFDIAVALAGMIVFLPLFAFLYVAIRRADGYDPIYRQERIGLHGRPFNIYKFRSMRPDAETSNSPQLCQGDDDSRLTPIGRFMRAHHLDEMPQLWNVIKGDMSIVGYRPERKYYINQIRALAPEYDKLYAMRPGLFSYATLYNGYTDTMAKMLTRLRMDLKYMHESSMATDIKIIWLTLTSILTGKKF